MTRIVPKNSRTPSPSSNVLARRQKCANDRQQPLVLVIMLILALFFGGKQLTTSGSEIVYFNSLTIWLLFSSSSVVHWLR